MLSHATSNDYQCFVGVDVAAATFTAAWTANAQAPLSRPVTFAQSSTGFAAFQRQLAATGIPPAATLVVMEASGSYWITLAVVLHQAEYVVSVVNPSHVHHFAKSQGQRAKTDALDAQVICRYAAERRPAAWNPPPVVYHELRQRLITRDACIAMRTQTLNQQHALRQWPVHIASAHTHLEALLATFEEHIAALDREIAHILTDSEWSTSALLLQTIPGIGRLSAAWLLVTTLNFTVSETAESLTAYAGLAPMAHESGTSIRSRPCIGHSGNRRLRHTLYMAALSAARANPNLRPFYHRLRSAGKPAKVAYCAVARKLLLIAWAVIKRQHPFEPGFGHPTGSGDEDAEQPRGTG